MFDTGSNSKGLYFTIEGISGFLTFKDKSSEISLTTTKVSVPPGVLVSILPKQIVHPVSKKNGYFVTCKAGSIWVDWFSCSRCLVSYTEYAYSKFADEATKVKVTDDLRKWYFTLPTFSQDAYDKVSDFSSGIVSAVFGSWETALRLMGCLTYNDSPKDTFFTLGEKLLGARVITTDTVPLSTGGVFKPEGLILGKIIISFSKFFYKDKVSDKYPYIVEKEIRAIPEDIEATLILDGYLIFNYEAGYPAANFWGKVKKELRRIESLRIGAVSW